MITSVVLDDLEKVASSNKGITVEDYINMINEQNKILSDVEKQEDEAIKSYFENLYDKYIVIHNNGANDNLIIFHCNKKLDLSNKTQKFDKIIRLCKTYHSGTNLQIEEGALINLLWLGCHDFNKRNCYCDVSEYITFIDEETYKKIYNKATSTFKEIFDVLSQN